MVQPFRVRDGDTPGDDKGGWSEDGDIDLPGTLTVDTVRGSTSGAPESATITVESMVEFLADVAFTLAVLNLEAAADATSVLTARVDGDTDPRFAVRADGRLLWGDGSGATDAELHRSGAGALETTNFFAMGSGQSGGTFSVFGGNLVIGSGGQGINIAEGDDARMGVATLTAGAATVATAAVTANSRIFLTSQEDGGGTPGFLRVSARTAATSFTITSSSGTDTSEVAWLIMEPSS